MKKTLMLLFALTITIVGLSAHPHVYIDLTLELDIDENGLKGFWESWTILRQFGENIGSYYDRDGDGRFDQAESASIREELFDNIRAYNYYTYIEKDGRTFFPENIRDFSVRKSGTKTIMRFYVPARIKVQDNSEYFRLKIYDLSRYVSFGLIYIDDPPDPQLEHSIHIGRDDNVYSHSHDFGNAVLHIDMQRKAPFPAETSPDEHNAGESNLLILTPENSAPSTTGANPFLSEGVEIADDNNNPFLGM